MLAFAALTCVLAPIAYVSMFTGFHPYDDEGYFLLTLRDYLSGQPLVTPYVPLYGPFFYEAMAGLLKMLGLEPGHDIGRWVTLAVWLVASLVGGLAIHKLTRHIWLAVAAQLVTFFVLGPLANEPMTTYGLISLLLICLVPAANLSSARPRAAAALIGSIVAALCLIKVNVGTLAFVAVAFAWAGSLPQPWRRLLLPPAAVVMAAAPCVLMFSLLNRDWVIEFAFVVTLSAAAVGLACVAATPGALEAPPGKWLAIGGTVTAVVCVGAAVAGGSRLEDLWHGLVMTAVRTPQMFVWPVTLSSGYDGWAVVSVAPALAIFGRQALAWAPTSAVGVARVGAGLFTWLSLLLLPSPLFLLALPLAWVATQPTRDGVNRPSDGYSRLLLPALAVLESLQAYPTAGSQLSIAALALVPVGALLLNDGIRQLRQAGQTHSAQAKVAMWSVPAVLLISITAVVIFAIEASAGFETSAPLRLPGADVMRVPAPQRTQLRGLSDAIDRKCSSFITLPGMDSLYLWTVEPPPTQLRYGQWWLILDGSDEQRIVTQLQARPRLCVVKNQTLLDFWLQGRDLPSRPLVDFVNNDFVDGGSFGDYELLVRAGQ